MRAMQGIVAAATLAASSGAGATLIGSSSEQSLQQLIDSLYQSPTCPTCSHVSQAPNVHNDQALPDELFAVEASGGSILTLIFEIAGNANNNFFGIYDVVDPTKRVQLYSGASGPGNSVMLGVDDTGMTYVNFAATGVSLASNQFGYYLQTPSALFYSQNELNAGAGDQMVAYQGDGDKIKLPSKPAGIWGSSSYILAWEDVQYSAGDKDFNDFVVYVESVTAVPEPGTLALLATGLLAFGATVRSRRAAVASAAA
jgi:hypothetical protein